MDLSKIIASESVAATPFRILTLVIFIIAIFHTLMANHFTHLAEKVAKRHARKEKNPAKKISVLAELLHFLGEIEVVFALWVIPLVIVVTVFYGWQELITYLNSRIYIEPFFIVVVMSLASTRPIIRLARKAVHLIAQFFGDTPAAWWIVVMILGPIFGSVITEAAAMTIAALLMKEKIYLHRPSNRLAYGTLGLMFVNFSVGGVLTNFAAPPALTVSRCWGWTLTDFLTLFGWRVTIGIVLVTALYFFLFRSDFSKLKITPVREEGESSKKPKVPIWVTLIHLFFLGWTIVMAHYPPIFMGGYLLFLGFHQATRAYQYPLNLKRPLMVGLFLAGLVIHGGFQRWWIDPLLGDLGYAAMMFTGTVLTAFNENTTVAYLGCLIDNLKPSIQYALVTGLVAGGGLTIIAHAPNPAGQALLRGHFKGGISPLKLFLSALIPTLIFLAIFFLFPPK